MSTAIAGQAYVTRDGDTLRTIAEQAYGDGAKWKLIYEANRERVQMADPETAVLSAGVRFELPAAPRERVTGSFAARERATGSHEKLPERERLTGAHDALEPREKLPERDRLTGAHDAHEPREKLPERDRPTGPHDAHPPQKKLPERDRPTGPHGALKRRGK